MTVHGLSPQEFVRVRTREVDLGFATPCWVSDRANKGNGYTVVKRDGRMHLTHRLAYSAFVGPIPDGLQLDHLCHDGRTCGEGSACPHRACCNPEHLKPVTPSQNAARSSRALQTHCVHGHEFTPENTRITPPSASRATGQRACRACARDHNRRNRKKELRP